MTPHIRTVLTAGVSVVVLAVGTAVTTSAKAGYDPPQASPAADSSPIGFTLGGSGYLREQGRFVPVNVPGATGTLPFGINDRGQIAGVHDDPDGVSHGFLLDRGRFTTIDHPDASGVLDGLAGIALISINSRGQATGSYVSGDRARGFVYDRGRFIPIDAPGAVQTSAFGINDRGQITVQALNPDGTEPDYLYEHGRFTLI